MTSPSTIGVYYDLAAGESCIASRSSDDEHARRVDIVNSLVVQVLGIDHVVDHVFLNALLDIGVGDVRVVLGGEEDGVHPQGLDHAVGQELVLDRHLGLAIRTGPRQNAFFPALVQSLDQFLGIGVGEGHSLRGFVGGIADHKALITGPDVLQVLFGVEGLEDLRGLLVKVDNDSHALVVHALVDVVIAYSLDGIPDQLFHIELGGGVNLAKDHAEVVLDTGLTGHLGVLVLF